MKTRRGQAVPPRIPRKAVRITFRDDAVQSVDIASVDDEGVLHSGPDGVDPAFFWTRFEPIRLVERISDS